MISVNNYVSNTIRTILLSRIKSEQTPHKESAHLVQRVFLNSYYCVTLSSSVEAMLIPLVLVALLGVVLVGLLFFRRSEDPSRVRKLRFSVVSWCNICP
jgi:hypothetical protein